MKYVKMLGLAAMAPMALMAFGAGSASATSHLYSTGVEVKAGTEVHITLQGSALLSTTDGKTLIYTCTTRTSTGKVEYPAGGDTIVASTSLTWGGCTATTDTLVPGKYTISSAGTVTGSNTVVTVNFGGVTCRYGTGAGTTLGTLNTGKLAVNAVINEQEPKSFICPDTTKWFASYAFTSPHDLSAGA